MLPMDQSHAPPSTDELRPYPHLSVSRSTLSVHYRESKSSLIRSAPLLGVQALRNLGHKPQVPMRLDIEERIGTGGFGESSVLILSVLSTDLSLFSGRVYSARVVGEPRRRAIALKKARVEDSIENPMLRYEACAMLMLKGRLTSARPSFFPELSLTQSLRSPGYT